VLENLWGGVKIPNGLAIGVNVWRLVEVKASTVSYRHKSVLVSMCAYARAVALASAERSISLRKMPETELFKNCVSALMAAYRIEGSNNPHMGCYISQKHGGSNVVSWYLSSKN
jgi:hypothetical protein